MLLYGSLNEAHILKPSIRFRIELEASFGINNHHSLIKLRNDLMAICSVKGQKASIHLSPTLFPALFNSFYQVLEPQISWIKM